MPNPRLLTAYQAARKRGSMLVGFAAASALSEARTRLKWELLEDAGLVQLIAEPDEFPDLADFDDARDREMAERDGVCGLIGQYRLDPDQPWQTGNSVWGFIGDDVRPENNPYTSGIMADTMTEFVAARREFVRGLCPLCHK